MSEVLMKVNNLAKEFKIGRNKYLKAVDGISFEVHRGETLGVVGESGCGKTTLGRTLINIYESSGGTIELEGEVLNSKTRKDRKKFSDNMQMIFQDPFASLNPRMTVGEIVSEGWAYRKMYTKQERRTKAIDLLKIVGLNEEHANRFPHEFSGGQRQRIGIARALFMSPEIMICDEPISALDVSIQAQVMNLLIELQKEKNLTYIFIAHDLSMVRYISTNIMVMYLGSQMEFGPSSEIYHHAVHPYTQALFSAIPVPDPDSEKEHQRIMLNGEIPSPINAPKGCKFSTRCSYAQELCKTTRPETKEVAPGHLCACHFPLLDNL
jgi:oligopeptide transport system ATP-binding protein